MATRIESPTIQYAGLGIFVLAEAIIFVPILMVAMTYSSSDVIPTAAILTGLMFAGLTAVVFMTKKDFSFLRSILVIGGFIAMGLIVCGAMVALACGAILYDTSNVLHHYRTDQHVSASLELFASIALLFWYVLRIVMAMSRD